MLANLPVEIILLICKYPEFKDLGQLAWTNKQIMQIIKRYLPIALERKFLFYLPYKDDDDGKRIICLFDSYNIFAKQIAEFTKHYRLHEVATTQNKIFGINNIEKSFEIYDLNTRQFSRGPNPPEWRFGASIAYFKGKLYYLGGNILKKRKNTNRVDVLIDEKWQTGPAFPFPITDVQTITCDEILYVIDGRDSRKIYRLSDDEWEWIKIGEIPERRRYFGVASLNGKIYIIGGEGDDNVFKSCLCFDPSAPVDNRISPIANMNYARCYHSLIVANEKLYAIGGFRNYYMEDFCNLIQEYDPQTNKWRKVGKLT